MSGEECADEKRIATASVDGFLKLPLIGGLVVPSMPSSNGGAPAAETEKAANR